MSNRGFRGNFTFPVKIVVPRKADSQAIEQLMGWCGSQGISFKAEIWNERSVLFSLRSDAAVSAIETYFNTHLKDKDQ